MTRAHVISILAFLFFFIPAPAAVSAADGEQPLEVKLDSVESMSVYYEDFGLILDREASDSRRLELDQECFLKGSRRFGRIPRPIRFVGLFIDPAEDSGERYTICMAIRPHDDDMAKDMCGLVGRPVQENRMMQMTVVCGPKNQEGETSG